MSRRRTVESGPNNVEDCADSDSLLDKTPQQTPVLRIPPAADSNQYCTTRRVCIILSLAGVLWLFLAIVNLVRDVFPETDLVLNSKCSAPTQNWDGKLLNVPIWWSSYTDRKPYFNLHNENEYIGNDTNHQIHLTGNAGAKRPVILFGTHHKTGTFLAKKLFSRICSKMNWCCLFHVTRDSIHALSNALQTEPVNALGHNQWIWNPNALDIAHYRFVHFYRNPYKKVISGYRYHADGTEEWTQKPLTYHEICTSPLQQQHQRGSSSAQGSSYSGSGSAVDAGTVWKFCESIHLCETCCRVEHEREEPAPGPGGRSTLTTFRRSPAEYQFLCDRLGRGKEVMDRALEEQLRHPGRLQHFHHTPTPSIQEMLLTLPAREGVLTEAALDYYENLRMARIINETVGNPHVLNVDIDDLNENFSDVTLRILRFLEGVVPSRRIQELHHDLAFYDLQTSPVYRWSMSNPIINHITGTPGGGSSAPAPTPSSPGNSGGTLNGGPHLKGSANGTTAAGGWEGLPMVATASSSYLMGVLRSDPQVSAMYAPIFEMMSSVLNHAQHTSKPSEAKPPAPANP